MNKFVLLACMALPLSACANFTPPAAQRPLAQEGTHWITYDSSRRGTLLAVKNGEVIRSCAEPAPDTAYSFTNSAKGSFKKKDEVEANAELAFNATALALAGRDNLVLLAREALFRLCEASANGDLQPHEYATQFNKVMEQVAMIAEVNKAQAKALTILGVTAATTDAKLRDDAIKSLNQDD